MPSAADEARDHLAQAEKALKVSFMSLKFSADHLTASLEFSQAATKFRAANMLKESAQAWVRSGECKEELSDLFGAGRAYESAGAVCDGQGPGGPTAAAEHWQRAIRLFRLSAKNEIAAKLILKIAALREKEGDVTAAKAAFEEAIDVYKDDEKLDYNLDDVYKQYVGFLLRSQIFEDAIRAIDGHTEVLARQKQFPFVHKELLAKVVLALHLKDTVRAEEFLNQPNEAFTQGWFTSKECQAGSELVAAFQNSDAEEATRVLKEQVWSFLQIEVARLAKQLRVFGAPRAAPALASVETDAAAGRGGGTLPPEPQPAEGPPTVDDIAESLM